MKVIANLLHLCRYKVLVMVVRMRTRFLMMRFTTLERENFEVLIVLRPFRHPGTNLLMESKNQQDGGAVLQHGRRMRKTA